MKGYNQEQSGDFFLSEKTRQEAIAMVKERKTGQKQEKILNCAVR